MPILTDLANLIIDHMPQIQDAIAGAEEKFKTFGTAIKTASTWAQEHATLLKVTGVAVGALTVAIVAFNAANALRTAATIATTGFGAAVSFLTSPITIIIIIRKIIH